MLTSSRGVADDSPDFESGIWAGRIVSPLDGGFPSVLEQELTDAEAEDQSALATIGN